MAGYTSPRILNIFRNRDIDFEHFYVEPGQIRQEKPGDLNNRYGRGVMETGCRAVASCLQAAQTKVTDIDFFIVCTSTGYVCPDIGSRLIAHMGLRQDIQRAAMLGLGCAGAVPTLRLACDFVRAYAMMLAVEICSACYFVDDTMDTVIGNPIRSDGAAALLITSEPGKPGIKPTVLDLRILGCF